MPMHFSTHSGNAVLGGAPKKKVETAKTLHLDAGGGRRGVVGAATRGKTARAESDPRDRRKQERDDDPRLGLSTRRPRRTDACDDSHTSVSNSGEKS